MLNEEKLKSFTLKSYAKDIVKVNDHIYFLLVMVIVMQLLS